MGKGTIGKLVKKGVAKAKKELKPKNLLKRAKSHVSGTLKESIQDSAKDKAIAGGAKFPVSKGGGRQARPDYEVSKTIEIKGDRKKRKSKKKIAKWESERRARASAGSKQAAFLALDKKIKSQKK